MDHVIYRGYIVNHSFFLFFIYCSLATYRKYQGKQLPTTFKDMADSSSFDGSGSSDDKKHGRAKVCSHFDCSCLEFFSSEPTAQLLVKAMVKKSAEVRSIFVSPTELLNEDPKEVKLKA